VDGRKTEGRGGGRGKGIGNNGTTVKIGDKERGERGGGGGGGGISNRMNEGWLVKTRVGENQG
jgi:hypothetical protein